MDLSQVNTVARIEKKTLLRYKKGTALDNAREKLMRESYTLLARIRRQNSRGISN